MKVISGKALISAAVAWLLGVGMAAAQDSDANNPLSQAVSFNIQNTYLGDLSGATGDDYGNQFVFRYARPFNIGDSNWVMRASLPINTLPVKSNGSAKTGFGDFDIFAAYIFDSKKPGVSVGIGPQLVAPTGEKGLGADQWQAGVAQVYFNASSKKVQYGYLATYRTGIGDTDGKQRVSAAAIQPIFFYQLGDGLYTGTAPTWTYDFNSDSYNVPVGVRLGKVIKPNDIQYNFFVEPQVSVASDGPGQADWQIFFAMNMQFGQ